MKYRLKFEKTKSNISICLFVGKDEHFVSVVEINKDSDTAEIHEFILPYWPNDVRNRGLGSIILALLEDQLREIGMSTVIGDVVEQDKGAEIFWHKQDYEISPCNEGPVRFTIKKELKL